ncbi:MULTISPECIES: hypothetical protein [Halorussus]|uniref:hypothetical protein n=1 Tax=Halorussus TaxID=1070314 RepID=UPI00209C9060|nr:hypothetical protein [Halorussus vallis]USZ74964.1 hypothetical protein NGM07_16180 [Halorussus vallis]
MNASRLRLRNGVRIAGVEFRRSLRALGGNPVQLAVFAVTALFFVGAPTAAGAYVALHMGASLLEVVPVVEGARSALAFLWLVPTIMVAQRAVGKTGRIDHADGMLTVTLAVDVVVGLLLAEYARLLAVVSLPILVVAASLAYGLGAPAAFATIVAALFALLTTAVLTGHLLGVLLKTVLEGSELLTRHKSALAALAFAAYLAAAFSEGFGGWFADALGVLATLPTGWFGDLLALGFPGASPSPIRIAGAVALFAVGVPVLLALDVRASTRLWYGDRARPAVRRHASSSGSNVRLLAGVASGPTRAIAAGVWRRTARGPLRLVYVVYPLLLLFAPLRDAVTTGRVPESLPVLLALYGTWAIGAAALNPLGDEGAMLPTTVTSTVRGRRFVGGHVLAVALVGLPVLVAVTATAGLLSPLAPTVWLPLTVAGGYLAMAGPLVALAIGTAFPRFGEVRITRSRSAVVPSKTAFVYYTLALVLGFGGSVVALVPGAAVLLSNVVAFWSSLLGHPVDVGANALRLGGGSVGFLLVVVAPPLAYRYAVRRFETYTLG